MRAKMTIAIIALLTIAMAMVGGALATPSPALPEGHDWKHAEGPEYQLGTLVELLNTKYFNPPPTFTDGTAVRAIETDKDLKRYLEVSGSEVDIQKGMHLYIADRGDRRTFWISNSPPPTADDKTPERGGAIGANLKKISLKETEGNRSFKMKVEVSSFSNQEQEKLREVAGKLGVKIDLSETVGATTIIRYFSATTEEWLKMLGELEKENAELRSRCDQLLRGKYQQYFETANAEVRRLEALKAGAGGDEAQLKEIDEWLEKWKGVQNKSPFQFVSGPQFVNSVITSKMGDHGLQSNGHFNENTVVTQIEDNSVSIGDGAVNPLVIIMRKAGSGAQLSTFTVTETVTRVRSQRSPRPVPGTRWN